MATTMDDRISMKEETTYGTQVVTDRFYPYLDDNESTWDARVRQADGLRGGTGRKAPLAARNYPTTGQGVVKIRAELESKAAGVLLKASLGTSALTVVTGGAQQLFTDAITGTYLPSHTIQVVKVQNDGTERVETYRGCTVSKASLVQPEDNIAYVEAEFDAAGYTTGTAAATVTYATAPVLFDAFQNVVSVGTSGLVVPTATAIASGLTASTEWREWKIDIDQQIDDADWKLSTRGRPIAGMPKIELSGKADFDSATLANGVSVGTQFQWYATTTTTETLGPGFTQLQVVLPKIVLKKDLPQVKRGETRALDISADVLNDGSNADVIVVYRSSDTAI
jgi:hypothetical protein